jgi:hypothetical protein
VPGFPQTYPATPVPGQQQGPSTPVPGYGPATPVPGYSEQDQGLYTSVPPVPVFGGEGPGANGPWASGASQEVFSTNPPPFSYLPEKKRSRRKPLLIGVAVVLVAAVGTVLALTLSSGGGKTPVAISTGTPTATASKAPVTLAPPVTHHWTLCCGSLQDAAGNTSATSSGVVLNSSKDGDAIFNGKAGTQIVVGGPVIDTEQGFTMAFWLNMHGTTTTPGGRETVVEQRGSQGCAACVEFDPNTQRFVFEMKSADSATATTTEVQALAAPKPADWYRIIVSYNAQTQTMAMYVGGVQQGTAKFDASWAPAGSLSFGSGLVKADTTNWYTGSLADMWIWNRAMTPTQVNTATSQ